MANRLWRDEAQMRVGILTLHAQTNYGAVLQAYALKSAIADMGHDVRVIDRWRDDDCARLKGILASRSPMAWLRWLKAAVSYTGVVAELRRRLATMRFIRENLNLTDYHFRYWKDAPRDMGLDVIVVGSDQVWNAVNLVPADYLLKETPPGLPGIAYAASIGMTAIPDDLRQDYCEGFRRFKAIAVRERTAAKMVADCGSHAEVVVDPTLLVPRSFWDRFKPAAPPSRRYVTCCFLLEDIDAMKSTFRRFTAEANVDIEMFVGGYWRWPTLNPEKIRKNRKDFRKWREAGVRLRLAAGPAEFAESIAGSSGVVTNSYHALLFSLIYGKNVRVMQASDPSRRVMSAKFDEAATFVKGPLFAKSLEEGLAGAVSGEEVRIDEKVLAARVGFSREWLKGSLDAIAREHA